MKNKTKAVRTNTMIPAATAVRTIKLVEKLYAIPSSSFEFGVRDAATEASTVVAAV